MAQRKDPFRINTNGTNELGARRSFVAKKDYQELVFHEGMIPNQINFRGQNQKYGRTSPNGVPLVLRESNLAQMRFAKDQRVIYAQDFVNRAWDDMTARMRNLASDGRIHSDSPFFNLQATRCWESTDELYNEHMNSLVYPLFTNEYLASPQKQRGIKSFSDFLREFAYFVRDTSNLLPVTRSGFIDSSFCPPYVSGLIIDTSEDATHDLDFPKGERYVHDGSFEFFADVANQHGFLIDQNAPWRLIFDISSTKGQEYMAQSLESLEITNPTSDEILEAYYENNFYPSLVLDIGILQVYLLTMYNAFVEKQPHAFEPVLSDDGCSTSSGTTLRQMVAGSIFDVNDGEYGWLWMLKTLYYCRLYETRSAGHHKRNKKGLRELYDVYYNGVSKEGVSEEAAFILAAQHLQKNIL